LGIQKTAVLLINLGTPDSPSVRDVRSYLSEFLNDPRVIDIPWLLRKILVNLIIVPFRAPKSAKIYKKLWTSDGSPLLLYGERVKRLLQESLPESHDVYLAMRYKNPSIPSQLEIIQRRGYDRLVVVPMFPQYASASTGSALDEVMRVIRKWWVIPELKVISQFYDHPDFIGAFIDRAKEHDFGEYDHVLFSYHGLPVRQVDKVYSKGKCSAHDCESSITEENKFCYKATCYATTRSIVEKLGIPKEKYTVAFQSRLDKDWLEPFSDRIVEDCAQKGMKKLIVFSPAFVADCLETIIEIGDEYDEIFRKHGGEKLQLVQSLNDHPTWIKCLKDLVLN
jgi:ferrochelatase